LPRTPWAAIPPEPSAAAITIAIAAEAAAITVAAEPSALTVAAEAAATVVTFTVAIGLAHHRRRAFLQLVDTNAEIANHVLADALLPLDLSDRRRRRVDVEQHEVRLAILVHAIGERAHTPVLGLGDLAAKSFDDARHLGRQLLDLLGARVLARKKYMLIE